MPRTRARAAVLLVTLSAAVAGLAACSGGYDSFCQGVIDLGSATTNLTAVQSDLIDTSSMTVNWQGLADAVEPATAALDTMAQGVSGDELAAVDVLRDFYGKLHDAAANQDLNAFVELNGDTAALTSASAQIVEIAAQHCA